MPDYNSPDELLAIVDEHDREIGSAPRRIIHERNLLHRAVHVIVFDESGKILIQERSALKDTFPLHWECVGGHLGPGETYYDAGYREVEEELGVPATGLELLAKARASALTGWEFIHIYKAFITGSPCPDPSEVIATCWLSVQELQSEIAASSRLFSPIFVNTLHTISLLH